MVYAILYASPEAPVARSTDITSFTEHRKRLREHISQVRETARPLYVTTNGKVDAVVLSPDAYDALADKAELAESLARLERSVEDVRAGRVRPATQALREIARGLSPPADV